MRLSANSFVLILPMRDWNHRLQGLFLYILLFWSYLWGIEIVLPKGYVHEEKLVLILPMRDWNIDSMASISISASSVLILPMRDWNQQRIWCRNPHLVVLILPMRDWNPVILHPPIFQLLRFDLTYEGLKSFQTIGCRSLRLVLILPMRDWNFKPSCLYSLSLLVLILPMRDWNPLW